ncbi:MAG: hypothetical protein PUH10_07980 [Erysipelotrichaceae bacterium]|nr:hypothetical protein [Erysipelotrichaceae bacterium]
MKITDSAKVILEQILDQENKNCITFFTQGEGCQTRLCMDCIVVTDAMQNNGLYVDMSEETARLLEDITLDAEDGNLVITSMHSCGSSCSSCSGGCGGCQ